MSSLFRAIPVLFAALLLAGCGESAKTTVPARIIAVGDSLFASNAGGVADTVEARLGEPVIDRSVSGARMIYALPVSGALGRRITSQYVTGDWDWIVMNGGGNDLWLGCGCGECDRRLGMMISPDGRTGEIPAFVAARRAEGRRVIYVGYLRTPGRESPIESCLPVGTEFENRLARMAARDGGVHFITLTDLVPHGDLSFHGIDRIHPSEKGSRAIGSRVADVILRNGG